MNDPSATCHFCVIVRRHAPATITYEDDLVLAFKDLAPMAPFHELVIPRQHIDSLSSAGPGEGALLGWMMLVGRLRAHAAGGEENGFRIVMNHGRDGHQTVGHMHLHVLAGRPLGWPPG